MFAVRRVLYLLETQTHLCTAVSILGSIEFLGSCLSRLPKTSAFDVGKCRMLASSRQELCATISRAILRVRSAQQYCSRAHCTQSPIRPPKPFFRRRGAGTVTIAVTNKRGRQNSDCRETRRIRGRRISHRAMIALAMDAGSSRDPWLSSSIARHFHRV